MSETEQERVLQDPYPTRLVDMEPSPRPRLDPVVWTEKRGTGPLSDAQLDFYDENGYLVIPAVFRPDEIAVLRQELIAFKEQFERKEENKDVHVTETLRTATEPGTGVLRSIYEAHKFSERFARLPRDRRLVGMAQQILDDEVYIHQSRINYQQRFEGRGFYWHQGFEAWHAEDGMTHMRALTSMIFLDKNMPQNGALMVVPGSQRTFIPAVGATPERNWEQSLSNPKYGIGTPDESLIADTVDKLGIEYCAGEPGTVVLLDCNVLHGSHTNISPWGRINVLYVYNSIQNALGEPYYAPAPRPEHLAVRQDVRPIMPE